MWKICLRRLLFATLSPKEEIPDDGLDPVIPIRPADALAAIQTLKDWEEQQDDSSYKVVRQLRVLWPQYLLISSERLPVHRFGLFILALSLQHRAKAVVTKSRVASERNSRQWNKC
jgi:hypothetical protein